MQRPAIPDRAPDFCVAEDRIWFHEMVMTRRGIDGEVSAYKVSVSDGNLFVIVTPRGSFWDMTRETNEAYAKWKVEQHRLLNDLITGDY